MLPWRQCWSAAAAAAAAGSCASVRLATVVCTQAVTWCRAGNDLMCIEVAEGYWTGMQKRRHRLAWHAKKQGWCVCRSMLGTQQPLIVPAECACDRHFGFVDCPNNTVRPRVPVWRHVYTVHKLCAHALAPALLLLGGAGRSRHGNMYQSFVLAEVPQGCQPLGLDLPLGAWSMDWHLCAGACADG
jgi:hypothetical protein